MSQPTPTRTRSVCPFCSVGCQLAYDAETDRSMGLDGAVNRDGRLCPKGIAAFDEIGADERLVTPLVREEGELRPASWEAALDRVASGFKQTIDKFGPDSLAFLGAPHCTNEENYLFQQIARRLGTNNVDNRARICHAATERAMDARLGSGAMTNTIEDLQAADAYLVVGGNPAERQPVAFDRALRTSVNDGASLVVLDPRESATARIADHHLTPRPGTDGDVLVAMAWVLIEEGLVDEAFIRERTTGFDAYREQLESVDIDATTTTAGIDPADLSAAAQAFGSADRAAAICGTGLEPPDHRDTTAPDALLNLLLLTGNLGRAGTGMNLLRGLNNEQGAIDMGCRPDALPGHLPVSDQRGRKRLAEVWNLDSEATDALAEEGQHELDLVSAFGEDIRAAWVFGENPSVTKLDAHSVATGMANLDMLVVQDTVWTETVDRAGVVLPASSWAEKAGTVTNLDRQVQRMRPAADPPGKARPDLAILCELGARLTGSDFAYGGPSAVFDEITRVCPPYAGMSYDGIGAESQRWPFPEGAESGIEVLHRERFEHGTRHAPFVTVETSERERPTELVLLSGRDVTSFVGQNTPETPDESDACLHIHPDDAAARGVTDGNRVIAETQRGTIETNAHVTRAVRPGTTFGPATLVDPIGGEGHLPVTIRPV